MDYYIDIKIQPDAEMRENVLMNKVYSKLHKALFDLNTQDVGVSFPEFNVMLGRVLRLHATEKKMEALQQSSWLGGLVGYCQISPVSIVPDNSQYRVVSRVQTTMSLAKLKRLIKRGSITESGAKDYKVKMFSKGMDNPYLELESGSNGHKHRRYFCFGELINNPVSGEFDSFGLSKTATVPWF